MGLLFADERRLDLRGQQETALIQRLGCNACPLRTFPGRMTPTGAERPAVYMLGIMPTLDEVKEGELFGGEVGDLLRARIPRKWKSKVRWNSVVRSHSPKTPVRREIEACRPSIIADIEATKPLAVFGFGETVLNWASGFVFVKLWRGRRLPVRFGSHVCWFYPMNHPRFIFDKRRTDRSFGPTDICSEDERMFAFDLERAFVEVADMEQQDPPVVHDESLVRKGVELILIGGDRGVELIADALQWAAKQPIVGVDYETSCLRPYSKNAKILTVGIGTEERSFAFPMDHREAPFNVAQKAKIKLLWREFLLSPCVKAVHNLAFEMEWSEFFFGPVIKASRWEDTASQASVIDERRDKVKPGTFSLEFLVNQYFGFNIKKMAGVNRAALADESLERVLKYNAPDAKYHLLLFQKQQDVIEQEGLQYPYELSLRRVPAVVLTQLRGVPVDQVEVESLQVKYTGLVEGLKDKIDKQSIVKQFYKETGHEYNSASHADNIQIFYRMLERKECEVVDKYTKQSKLSAAEDILAKIDHPLARLVIRLRKAQKQKSTYIDPLCLTLLVDGKRVPNPDTVIYPDGRLHATFNTFFAETGRLSCEGPNLQNYPKRAKSGDE